MDRLFRIIVATAAVLLAAPFFADGQRISVPSWISEPEEDVFVGISFPGESRGQALALAELSMCFGTEGAVSVSNLYFSQAIDAEDWYMSNSVYMMQINSYLKYDIVNECRLESGEYAVAIRRGGSISRQVRIVWNTGDYSTGGRMESSNGNCLSYSGMGEGNINSLWIMNTLSSGCAMALTSEGYHYTPESDVSLSYGLNETAVQGNSIGFDYRKEYVAAAGMPLSLILFTANLQQFISRALSDMQMTHSMKMEDGKTNSMAYSVNQKVAYDPVKYTGISIVRTSDGTSSVKVAFSD